MPVPSQPSLAVVGCTGAVGQEMLAILESRGVPHRSLKLMASARSAGRTMPFAGADLPIVELTEDAFEDIDLALFSAGGDRSRTFAPAAVAAGCTVIDNSSAFRMEPRVPLVIPEVNGEVLEHFQHPGIIANPNCSTIIALMAVTPLHRAAGIERMVISTYQAASGAGAAFMEELEQQCRDHAAGTPYTTGTIGRQYIFNLFSHDSAVGDDGYNQEERKMVNETHRIWDDPSVAITATCVRVPVLRAHCESINLRFRQPLSEADAREVLSAAPGVTIVDDRAGNSFPEPIHASGADDVLVGRLRADISQEPSRGLELFVAGDQLRKGAALNAIQIAEALMARAGVAG